MTEKELEDYISKVQDKINNLKISLHEVLEAIDNMQCTCTHSAGDHNIGQTKIYECYKCECREFDRYVEPQQ